MLSAHNWKPPTRASSASKSVSACWWISNGLEREPGAGAPLRAAKLKERGVIEDIDYQHPRRLDRKLMRTLATSEWVRQHQNLLLIGPTGIGKTGWPARWRRRLAAMDSPSA